MGHWRNSNHRKFKAIVVSKQKIWFKNSIIRFWRFSLNAVFHTSMKVIWWKKTIYLVGSFIKNVIRKYRKSPTKWKTNLLKIPNIWLSFSVSFSHFLHIFQPSIIFIISVTLTLIHRWQRWQTRYPRFKWTRKYRWWIGERRYRHCTHW